VTSSLKYARLERERRFLLARAADPAEGDHGDQVLHIEDRHLAGTRLRLRLVRRDGQGPVYKLGQKIRVVPAHPSTVAHTTLYLDRRDYESLRHLRREDSDEDPHAAHVARPDAGSRRVRRRARGSRPRGGRPR